LCHRELDTLDTPLQSQTFASPVIRQLQLRLTDNQDSPFAECPCEGTTLDKLIQPAVLAILAKGQTHGYELARKISDIPHFLCEPPDVSGIYRILKTLETRGLVTSDWDVSKNGRPKRIFTITDTGRQCLEHWMNTLENYHRAIASLLETTRDALGRIPDPFGTC